MNHHNKSYRKSTYFLVVVFFASMLFDFKRGIAVTDSDLAVVLGVINIVIGTTLVFVMGVFSKRIGLYALPFIFFLVFGLSSGLLRGQGIYDLLSASTPLIIFLLAMIVVASYARSSAENSQILNMLIYAALASAIIKIFIAGSYYKLDFSYARYHLLSGSIPLLFAYGITGFLFARRKLAFVAIILSLALVSLSITRTYLFVFTVTTLSVLILFANARKGNALKRIISTILVITMALIVIYIMYPDLAVSWLQRITFGYDTGVYLTAATRLAEASYQINSLQSDVSGLLFGFGFRAETYFDGKYALLVESVLGSRGSDYQGFGYGHIFYVGLIFVGGLFAGSAVIMTLARIVFVSIRSLKFAWDEISPDSKYLAIVGISASIGYMVYGMFAGTWGDRSASFFFGASIGASLSALRWVSR